MFDDLRGLPGGDQVARGLDDLRSGARSEESLLVALAAPRLRGLGLEVPPLPRIDGPYEHALYEMIEARVPRGAHTAYNALLGRVVSFANAYGRTRREQGRTWGEPPTRDGPFR